MGDYAIYAENIFLRWRRKEDLIAFGNADIATWTYARHVLMILITTNVVYIEVFILKQDYIK